MPKIVETPMTKHQLGVRAARQVRSAEHQMDRALAETLLLGHLLLTGRIEAGFGLAVGQGVLDELANSFSLMTQARGAFVSAHDALADAAQEHDVRWRMDGPLETKPIKPSGVAPTLSVVA